MAIGDTPRHDTFTALPDPTRCFLFQEPDRLQGSSKIGDGECVHTSGSQLREDIGLKSADPLIAMLRVPKAGGDRLEHFAGCVLERWDSELIYG